MKNRKSILKNRAFALLLGVVAMSMLFSSCDDNEVEVGPITISKVYLEDVNATVADREVTFARLGQIIRIEGTGFTGLERVYINGFKTYFNPVMASDESMLVSIASETPIVKADPELRNTIVFENEKYTTTFTFDIRSAAPTITNISNTLPKEGEIITVSGSGLLEVSKVVFPGNIEVTEGITSDEEGAYFYVTMPAGVSEDGGSLFIECANGGAYSPAYFNFVNGIILNFDGVGSQGYWGSAASMIQPEDLVSDVVGDTNVSHGTYASHIPLRIDTVDAAKNRASEVWTAGNDVDDWRGQLTPFISAATSVDQVAFQFDIFVPEAWSGSGFLKVCLFNAFNGGEWAGYSFNYVPWIVNGEEVPFQTTSWTTVTIPFSEFYEFSDGEFTFEDVLIARETTSYKNFGFYFENSDFTLDKVTGNTSDAETEFLSTQTSVNIYTDNWRIVSLDTPIYSDFPEEEVSE